GLGGSGIPAEDDPAPGPRVAEHGVGSDRSAVDERDRLTALQRTALGAGRHPERICRRHVEPAGANVLVDRVPDGRDAVVDREDEDPVAVALERLAGPDLPYLERIRELAED